MTQESRVAASLSFLKTFSRCVLLRLRSLFIVTCLLFHSTPLIVLTDDTELSGLQMQYQNFEIVLSICIYLILYLECFSLDHMNR